MGFDNECILNIQSLPGEYFCPVCRTLVYPNEALQTACTHLFCKPCLAYTVATTSACPYDGYLVTETDAKPLVESGKPIAEAIEKIQVHCLYHRSGCQWQGTLSECINHCTSCTFGSSPVVCNRCGVQIIHRQVQEHAQTCPGVQPQAQQVDPLQSQSSALQSQALAQSVPPTPQQSSSKPGASAATVASGSTSIPSLGTAAVPVVDSAAAAAVATTAPVQRQPTAASQPQVAAQAPTQEQQWYQQYYQQYPGFDLYQQQYQQYGYYQQQAQQQPSQTYGQSHPVQGQQHSQSYAQQYPQALPQPQVQSQYPQVHGQPHAQAYGQHHPQPQQHVHPQVQQIHSQSPTVPVGQHVQAQAQPLQPQKHVPGQLVVQQQSQVPQLHAHALSHAQPPHLQHQPRPQPQQQTIGPNLPVQSQRPPLHAQYQSHPNFHGHAQLHQPTNPQLHVQSQAYPRPHSTSQPPLQPQLQSQVQTQRPPHPLNQGQSQPIPQSHPTAPTHTVTGHQSFPQPHLQHQMPGAGIHQRPMQMHHPQHGHLQQQHQHPGFTQDQSQVRTSHQMALQNQQQASVSSTHGSHQQFPSGPQHAHPSLPLAQTQVQHPTNVQAPWHPATSVYEPQIPQHQGSFSSQPHNQTQQNSQHQGRMSLSQEHLPQPPFQLESQTKTQSIPENHTLSHQQSKSAPVESHNLPLESDNAETQLPSSPSSLKPSAHEETDPGANKTGFLELAPHKTDVMTDVESNTDEKKEEKIDDQSDEEIAGSVGNDVAETLVKCETTDSDISQHRISLEHKDGEDGEKLVHVEEIGSKSDGSDRRLSDGSGKIQMRDDTGGIPPSQAVADQDPQPLAPKDSIRSDERLNLKGPHEEPVDGPALDRTIPGYLDKTVPALPNQVYSSDDLRNTLPPQMQPNPEVTGTSSRPLMQHHGRHVHGPSYMQDASFQRPPPVVDRMLPKHMPYLVPQQDKMFQETSPRVLPHGQPLTSNQVRPSLTPTGNNPAPVLQGSHVPFAQGPSFMPPVGSQLQSHFPAPQSYDASGMAAASQVERFSSVHLQGPPAGPFGPGISMNGRAPLAHSEGQPLHTYQPSSYDGSHDHIHLMATEGFATGNQAGEPSKMIATNSFPGHTDSSLPHALVGERFMPEDPRKLSAAEGFLPPADPHFRPYGDPVRRVIDRRKLEEDLKQFPRPSELDSQGGVKFGAAYAMHSAAPFDRSSYSDNASRTFDRGMPGFHPEALSGVGVRSPISSRSMPIYKAGSHIPNSSDMSSLHQIESMDRKRLFNAGHSEFHRSGSEFGNHRMDASHLSRSPGIELSGPPTNRFGSIAHGLGVPGHAEGFGGVQASGLLPNHLRMSNGIMPGMRGGDRTDRDMMRGGDSFGAGPGSFHNHLPGGKLGVVDNVTADMYSRDFLRVGDYRLRDFSGDQHSLSSGSFQSGPDSLDISRKRKESGTGWCLICNIYCETDEGRNLHYQTLEHQNRTMDIVSSIKQRYSKKLTVSSDEHEESNKLRKADVEDRPNRH